MFRFDSLATIASRQEPFLPVSHSSGTQHAPARYSARPAPQPGPVALIIEDNELVRTSQALLLRHRGFTVLTANDGAEGVETFNTHKDEIDLVITDHSMPRKNGTEVQAEIAAICPEMPVMLISSSTGHLSSEVLGQFDEVMQKPFDTDEFIAKARWLSGCS